jgi:ubiquinone/menaquinone biosynthesis C-methylase UbiE
MLSADEANRRYFRQAYRSGEHGWAVDEPSPYTVNFLERLMQLVPGGKLLDVGCGEGRHSFAAAQLGFRVTGIDYEPLALERARSFAKVKNMEKVRFRLADFFSLPFPDSSFDILLDCNCLHHQRKTDWPAYKASLLRVLKPQGFYLLSAFSPRFHLFRSSRRKWHIAYGAYRRCFTVEDILELLGSDFELLQMVEQKGRGGGFWHTLTQKRGRKD